MSENAWIGAIYLKDEGGYEIVLKSLRHYKNRLKTISNSPELKCSNICTSFKSTSNENNSKN